MSTVLFLFCPFLDIEVALFCFCNLQSHLSQVKTLVIGLGAGLLPMFLHECIRFLHIEVILSLQISSSSPQNRKDRI